VTTTFAPQNLRTALFRERTIVVLGFAALAIPTIFRVGTKAWSFEDQGAGPLLLATGAWLLWRALQNLPRQAGTMWLALPALFFGLGCYIFGAAYDYVSLEAGGLYVAGVALLFAAFGFGLWKVWFPIAYLALSIPPPPSWISNLTAPLKEFVSYVSTNGLAALGVPVAREGVTIYVAQYQLLVEDACSGMNSLIGLSAVSLLYVYLMRGQVWWYILMVWAVSIPIAIAANMVRIALLVVITYVFGNEVGQSFIHEGAGLVLFTTALGLVAAFDALVMRTPLGRRVAPS
jgi:exosortase